MAFSSTFPNASDDNAASTLHAFLLSLGTKVTKTTVRESLEQHPDFPSMLSLSDALTNWQVDNTGLQLNTTEQLRELLLPFMAHFRKAGGWYVLVTALEGDRITYTDSIDGPKIESLTDFKKKWSGIVLLAEANKQSGEVDYATKRSKERLNELRSSFLLISALLVFLVVILNVAKYFTATEWLLLSTKALGLTLSGLLVAKQLGRKNALTDRLCRITSKTNCDDVLKSPAAKLWGWLSWADIGLLYFSGGLLAVLSVSILPEVRSLLSGLALFALPYTVFSIYYQARILRQWCTLCLGIQGLLIVEGILATTQLNSLPDYIQPYLLILIAFLLPTLMWVFIKPLLTHLPKSQWEYKELMWLKRNPDLFRTMLMQQPQMLPIPEDLHPIVLGNPEAEHTITVVTNPYCGPCARTHKELEQLLDRNENLKAKIIFTCDGKEELTTQVARHAIALAEQGNVARALTDWYQQPKKNFDMWAKKHPIKPSQTDWVVVANQHQDWCRVANITVTPTLFIDGYQLPELYQLDSLKWLINYIPLQTSMMDLAKSK